MRRGAWWAGIISIIPGFHGILVRWHPPPLSHLQRTVAINLTYWAGACAAVNIVGCMCECPSIDVVSLQRKCKASCGMVVRSHSDQLQSYVLFSLLSFDVYGQGLSCGCALLCFMCAGYFQNLPQMTKDGTIVVKQIKVAAQDEKKNGAHNHIAKNDFKLQMLNGQTPGATKQKSRKPKKISPVE